MKKLALSLFSIIVAGGFSVGAMAAVMEPSAPQSPGVSPGALGLTAPFSAPARQNPVAPPNSRAFGKSLNDWMGTYLDQFVSPTGAVGEKNVKFLPIVCDSPPCTFDMSIRPGTALALPLATWIGCLGVDPVLPVEWWGDPNHIFTATTLDGTPIAQPNAAYLVGPSLLSVPVGFAGCQAPAEGEYNAFYQVIGVVIKPLPPGEHNMDLRTDFVDFGVTFYNAWNIRVVPAGKR
jgi:hypothetical protein